MCSMSNWSKFKKNFHWFKSVGFGIDVSNIHDFDIAQNALPLKNILLEMLELEKGAIANADENRQVGHYWLRNPDLAPTEEIKSDILETLEKLKLFVAHVHAGEIFGQTGNFENVLCLGIGGSALGPQLASKALASGADKMNVYFLDNTDPDGIDQVLEKLRNKLGQTLVIVASKSGGTPETRNCMIEVQKQYEKYQLTFAKHAVCVSCRGSKLDKQAEQENWLARFPMWDWVGGRTSISSIVGLLPMFLQGINFSEFLRGMKEIDQITRENIESNPAYLLALSWYAATKGKGEKTMVIIPYKDRLSLLSAFLQQLIMESLGKKLDRAGNEVYQGISVFGNKGSTDQHAYVQQLRDGIDNFFVTFVEVLHDRDGEQVFIDENITSGDYLEGFLLGTRQALTESNRESLVLTISKIDAFHLGVLIGLYERAVGFYATMVNINAYHQPGVEAGKKAANAILNLQKFVMNFLNEHKNQQWSVEDIADKLQSKEELTIFKILEHLAANDRVKKLSHANIVDSLYQAV